MKKTWLLVIVFLWHLFPVAGWSQKRYTELTASEKALYDEHVVKGQPDGDEPVFVRNGYVLRYHDVYRIPEWVVYHIKPDYLNTPKREKKYKTFRVDPDVPNPVKDGDYTNTGYARGHMAPYFAMGGDRDRNGVYSNSGDDRADPYDDRTVFQANYMSNIAPQDQAALNGPGGPWYSLETAIRNKLVGKHEMELHVFAGSIISDPDEYYVLVNQKGETDIAIPDQFYQVLVYYDRTSESFITAAFLFPHVNDKRDLPSTELLDYLVTVDEIEAITGLDFLHELSAADQNKTESKKNFDFWEEKMK